MCAAEPWQYVSLVHNCRSGAAVYSVRAGFLECRCLQPCCSKERGVCRQAPLNQPNHPTPFSQTVVERESSTVRVFVLTTQTWLD